MSPKTKRTFKHIGIAVYRELPTFFSSTLGALIYSVGVVCFTMAYRFPDAGVTGIAVLANYTFGISPAWVVGIGNVLLLAWGWKEMSGRFVAWTIYGVVLTTTLFQVLSMFSFPHIGEPMLVAIFGGVVKGIGGGLVLRAGVSLGGTDILVLVLRKRRGIEVGRYSFYINMVIVGFSAWIVGFERSLLGVVALYVSGVVIDSVISSFDKRLLVFIISQKPQEISDYIVHTMGRGVTLLSAKGGYSGADRPTIMCLLSKRESMVVKTYLAQNDTHALMSISESSEVLGRGFKNWKHSF